MSSSRVVINLLSSDGITEDAPPIRLKNSTKSKVKKLASENNKQSSKKELGKPIIPKHSVNSSVDLRSSSENFPRAEVRVHKTIATSSEILPESEGLPKSKNANRSDSSTKNKTKISTSTITTTHKTTTTVSKNTQVDLITIISSDDENDRDFLFIPRNATFLPSAKDSSPLAFPEDLPSPSDIPKTSSLSPRLPYKNSIVPQLNDNQIDLVSDNEDLRIQSNSDPPISLPTYTSITPLPIRDSLSRLLEDSPFNRDGFSSDSDSLDIILPDGTSTSTILNTLHRVQETKFSSTTNDILAALEKEKATKRSKVKPTIPNPKKTSEMSKSSSGRNLKRNARDITPCNVPESDDTAILPLPTSPTPPKKRKKAKGKENEKENQPESQREQSIATTLNNETESEDGSTQPKKTGKKKTQKVRLKSML